MDKQTLLEQIKEAVASGTINRQELIDAYESALPGGEAAASKRHLTFSEAIQYLGSGIVFIGISLLVAQNWNTLGVAVKILVTLGSALVAFAVSIALLRRETTHRLGYAFILISILLLPVGVYSVFEAIGVKFSTDFSKILYELILIALYIAALAATRLRIYIVLITFFSTALYFTLTGMVGKSLSSESLTTFTEYRFLVLGLSYLLFGYFYTQKQNRILAALFYIFGILAMLGSAMALGGFDVQKTVGQGIWEFGYPVLVFIAMYFSIFVRQTKILVLSALFLMGYVLKISAEYFSGSLGWPLAVVIAGLLMIAVGYLSLYLNRRYIKQTQI